MFPLISINLRFTSEEVHIVIANLLLIIVQLMEYTTFVKAFLVDYIYFKMTHYGTRYSNTPLYELKKPATVKFPVKKTSNPVRRMRDPLMIIVYQAAYGWNHPRNGIRSRDIP